MILSVGGEIAAVMIRVLGGRVGEGKRMWFMVRVFLGQRWRWRWMGLGLK